MKVLLSLTEHGRTAVEYHYQLFRPASSALPLSRLAAYHSDTLVSPKDPANEAFKAILAKTPEKLDCAIMHDLGFFEHKLKEAVRDQARNNLACSLSCLLRSGQEQLQFQHFLEFKVFCRPVPHELCCGQSVPYGLPLWALCKDMAAGHV